MTCGRSGQNRFSNLLRFQSHPIFGHAYRLMYVVNPRKALYVLHAFMKKSKSGMGLPKPDAELIQARLQSARIRDAED